MKKLKFRILTPPLRKNQFLNDVTAFRVVVQKFEQLRTHYHVIMDELHRFFGIPPVSLDFPRVSRRLLIFHVELEVEAEVGFANRVRFVGLFFRHDKDGAGYSGENVPRQSWKTNFWDFQSNWTRKDTYRHDWRRSLVACTFLRTCRPIF